MALCSYQSAATTWRSAYSPNPNPDGTCVSGSDSVILSLAEYADYVAIKTGSVIGLTTADALYAFSWGFGAVSFFWALGYALTASKHAIKIL